MPCASLTKTDIFDTILSKIVMKGMRMKEFFGRDELIESMKSLWSKRVPSLVTCRGRRRVGKSTLVAEFARRTGAMLIKLEGLRPNERMTNDDQLKYFISQLSLQTNCDDSPVSDWLKAFARLNEQIPDRGKPPATQGVGLLLHLHGSVRPGADHRG